MIVMILIKKYNGWNLMRYKDGPIVAHCPHCAYSAPDYIDTSESILFKYCPGCGSKLSDDECVVDLEQLCYEDVISSIKLSDELKIELSKCIDKCYNTVTSRYAGYSADSRNCSEICSLFSKAIEQFAYTNHFLLPDKVNAVVSHFSGSVDIIFPNWVAEALLPLFVHGRCEE